VGPVRLQDDEAGVRLGIARGEHDVRARLRAAARLERIPPTSDYVLVARPGLPEAAEARGFEWLGERVDEVLGKSAA